MTDHQPPPEEPLSDQARARIRAGLLAAAQDGSQGSRRWVVPLAAAASVVLVAGLTVFAMGRGGDDSAVGEPITPASSTTDDGPEPTMFPAPAEPDSCPGTLEEVLPGADLAVEVPVADNASSTSFWVAGDEFAMCDARGGVVAVRGPMPLVPDLDDRSTFRFLFTTSSPDDLMHPGFGIAGGAVPDGALAYDISAEFQDGRTEVAEKTTDQAGRTWWWLTHDSGAGDDGDSVRVTLSLSGVQKIYTVPWGLPG